jgi:hypothetical protein
MEGLVFGENAESSDGREERVLSIIQGLVSGPLSSAIKHLT